MKRFGTLPGLFAFFAASCFLFLSFSEDGWKLVKSDEGKFSIMMPDTATRQSKNVQSDAGEITMHLFIYDASKSGKQDDNLVYLANYTDYPEAYSSLDAKKIDDVLNSAVNGAVKNVKGDIISQKDISKKNYKGKEFFINFQKGRATIHAEAFLVKNRMYLVETIYPPSNKGNKADARFMGSFDFTY